jgi:alpha,alpha-trehalase
LTGAHLKESAKLRLGMSEGWKEAHMQHSFRGKFRVWGLIATLTCSGLASSVRANPLPLPNDPPSNEGLQPILGYISSGWDTLTRSMDSCSTVVDPKLAAKSILYLPADFPVPEKVRNLESQCGVEVKALPKVLHHPGEIDTNKFYPHGLLYLEHPYVVPGGRFNEMYGWDSYFIIRGLVRAGRIELARGMVENFFFEIEHYGSVLNANRTYYLSRSQPPFLTSMILAVHEAEKAKGHDDRAWLERAYGFASRDYEMWVREPHLAGDTGLSRYFDFGEGPAAESLKDETDHYQQVAAYFIAHPEANKPYFVERNPGDTQPLGVGGDYSLQICSMPRTMERPRCVAIHELALSGDYYKGDRSMRESGFDISFRFGAYGAATQHFAPVCLNSLLFKTEHDLYEISKTLGHAEEAQKWSQRADVRKSAINKYLWDEERGEFFDFNFDTKTRTTYEYASTFYPLWAGLATKEQANAVLKNIPKFERPGGLQTSPYETGVQWDAPYAWAPLQFIGVEGLRRYGFDEVANRVSYAFVSTVAENFKRDGTIREKYNAATRSTDAAVKSGYQINVIGFGWTNAAFLEFVHQMPAAMVDKLAREQTAK